MLEILADVTTRMIEGELIQNDLLYCLDTTRKDYFEIQERKTALLFAACMETGAVLAKRSEADADSLRRYGLEIGRAFQLIDDLLDYTATSEQLGKPAFSDLREGKLTLPMLTLLERAPEPTKEIVQRIWDHRDFPILAEDEQSLRELIRKHEALSETRELARRATKAALEILPLVEGDKGIRRLLEEIPDVLLERSR
jgi:octaprenyl-diphosphate synthase